MDLLKRTKRTNQVTAEAIKMIGSLNSRHGCTPQDTMVCLEGVVAGICIFIASTTTSRLSPQEVFELLVDGVPVRFAQVAKLANPEGKANG